MMKYNMQIVKKLLPAPLFLISFWALLLKLNPLFNSYDFIFSLSLDTLVLLIILGGLICLSSLLFVLFTGLANDWKIVLPAGGVAALMPILILPQGVGLVFLIGTVLVLLITFLSLENVLKSYLTFTPSTIFGPSVRHMSGLLILLIAITYFLSISKVIAQKGFTIPDSLIDQAIKLSGQTNVTVAQEQPSQPSISPQQLELLKKNPQLLKQYGLDPSILNNINQPASSKSTPISTNDVVKSALKTQLDGIIKPYLGAIPALLAVLFFFILQSFTAILNILIYPLLWLIFKIFEKSGFVKFEVEQRSVRKMVV